MPRKMSLRYDNGTLVIGDTLAHIPYATIDPRIHALRAAALYYSDITKYLRESAIGYNDFVLNLVPSPKLASSGPALRDYQQRALEKWTEAGMRGCIVLPTGAGKTMVGIKAIEKINAASLVVVPTLDLVDQWTDALSSSFGGMIKVGNLGGGKADIQPVTVATYDSAYMQATHLGNKFLLVIFDEVHHLAAPGYRYIAEQMAAPYRLGLTATIEREDDLHKDLPRLVGGVVFQASATELANKKHLAAFQIEQRHVKMSPLEQREYQENINAYHDGLRNLGINMNHSNAFKRLIMMSAKNKIAREALIARNRATNIAFNSSAKIEELREILAENKGLKTIIFTQHNSIVYDIADRFLIPCITHKTGAEERRDILAGFREGRYMAVVTSKVLDEGVDVPDAELGIVLSGTGSGREFIQRLGRLLRPKKGEKKVRLIEIISSDTREAGTSAKRNRAMTYMSTMEEAESHNYKQDMWRRADT